LQQSALVGAGDAATAPKSLLSLFFGGRRWEGAKLSNKFDDQKTQTVLCCSIIMIMTTSVHYLFIYLFIIIMIIIVFIFKFMIIICSNNFEWVFFFP
jgi:hypothetical protein